MPLKGTLIGAYYRLVALLSVLVLAGCSISPSNGGKRSSGTGASEPAMLREFTLCESVPRDVLVASLGLNARSFTVSHYSDVDMRSDSYDPFFSCIIEGFSSSEPVDLEITFNNASKVNAGDGGPKPAHFDDIATSWPKAKPVNLEGRDGKGWSVFVEPSKSVFVFWRYRSGGIMKVQLRYSGHMPSDVDLNKLRNVMLSFVDVVPAVTEGPSREHAKVTNSGAETR